MNRWLALTAAATVLAMSWPPGRTPVVAAPASGTQAIIAILEFAFGTRLTEAQRSRIATATRGAPQEAEREVVQIARQLEAEIRSAETWVEETRARAKTWVTQVARSDPGLTSLVKSGDPDGAAPGLSLRARDAVVEMLLNWVSVTTDKAAWSGSENDLAALRAEVVRWYLAAGEGTKGLYRQADRIWGGLRMRWNKTPAAMEQSKGQLRKDLPEFITAREQGGWRWWTQPALSQAMRDGTFFLMAAASAIRADFSLTGDSPYYATAELDQPAVPNSFIKKREVHDLLLFFAFALDTVLLNGEVDSLAQAFANPKTVHSPQVQEMVRLIRQIVGKVRATQREMADGQQTLRRGIASMKGIVGDISRELEKNLKPAIAGDPYGLTRQHLESMVEFLAFSESVQRGQWIALGESQREDRIAVLLRFFKQAGPSDKLMLSVADLLWGEFRETAEYRQSVQRLGPMPASTAARGRPASGGPPGDPEAGLRAERMNDRIQMAYTRAMNFQMRMFRY